MASSVFYYHRSRLGKKDPYDKEKKAIRQIFNAHKGLYGYRRVTEEMRRKGFTINHKTVYRLMKEMDLTCTVRKARYHTFKGEGHHVFPNILQRDFSSDAPNRKWVTDITRVDIKGRHVYVSPILDLYNGEIISCNISFSPNMKLVLDMLRQCVSKVKDLEGIILHSDQGWHYQHFGYVQELQRLGIVQSMSRKGNCLDNAVIENFFGLMKMELLYAQKFDSAEAFIKALKKYLRYYNNRRIKSRLNGLSPVQFRLSQSQSCNSF